MQGTNSISSVMTYVNFNNWPFASRLQQVTTVSDNLLDFDARTRTYTYNSQGAVTTETTDYGVNTFEDYDDFGHAQMVTTSGNGVAARQKQFEYDSKGRFVTKNHQHTGAGIDFQL